LGKANRAGFGLPTTLDVFVIAHLHRDDVRATNRCHLIEHNSREKCEMETNSRVGSEPVDGTRSAHEFTSQTGVT
jgi:hypothetical protein